MDIICNNLLFLGVSESQMIDRKNHSQKQTEDQRRDFTLTENVLINIFDYICTAERDLRVFIFYYCKSKKRAENLTAASSSLNMIGGWQPAYITAT